MSADPLPLPLTLSEASGVPFYRQIVDQLSDLIDSGTLSPDQPLPSIRLLARQLLVSVITVRRAYADLEAAGLIDRRARPRHLRGQPPRPQPALNTANSRCASCWNKR